MKLIFTLLFLFVGHLAALSQNTSNNSTQISKSELDKKVREDLFHYKLSLVELASLKLEGKNKEISQNLLWLQDKKTDFAKKSELLNTIKSPSTQDSIALVYKENCLVELKKIQNHLNDSLKKLESVEKEAKDSIPIEVKNKKNTYKQKKGEVKEDTENQQKKQILKKI